MGSNKVSLSSIELCLKRIKIPEIAICRLEVNLIVLKFPNKLSKQQNEEQLE